MLVYGVYILFIHQNCILNQPMFVYTPPIYIISISILGGFVINKVSIVFSHII